MDRDKAVEAAITAWINLCAEGEPQTARWTDDYTEDERQDFRKCMRAALTAADEARAVTDEEVLAVMCLSTGLGEDILDDMRKRGIKMIQGMSEENARQYLIRNVLRPLHPRCEPLPTLMGVCTQVDNATTEILQLRAQVAALLKVKEAAEAALADTERHPLLRGFVHGSETRKELQDRLNLIAGGLMVQLDAYNKEYPDDK